VHLATSILFTIALVTQLAAADIDGLVVVKHRLTKRRVTAPAGEYERGIPVKLASDQSAQNDVLAYERAHVVIYVEGAHPAPQTSAVIEQKNRRFLPDLVVIPAGSSVSFPNFDPIFHNVFSLSKAKSFDLGNYSKGQTRTVRFPSPGVVLVNCHLHTNMAASIVVTPNGFFASPSEEGRFSLKSLPPGTHTVVAGHKSAGFFRKTVTVGPNQNATVEFVIPLNADGTPEIATSK